MSEQLQAGTELDVIVAEKVMGWKKGVDYDVVDYSEGVARYIPFTNDVLVFRPSSDWNSMRLVVEEMHNCRYLFDLSISVGAGYSARFYNRDKEEFHAEHYIESAPYAVCLAALKALNAD